MTIDDMELNDVNLIYNHRHKLHLFRNTDPTDVHCLILDSIPQLYCTRICNPTTTSSPPPKVRHHHEQELEHLQAAVGAAFYPADDRLPAKWLL